MEGVYRMVYVQSCFIGILSCAFPLLMASALLSSKFSKKLSPKVFVRIQFVRKRRKEMTGPVQGLKLHI
jgi:hypothetical protein